MANGGLSTRNIENMGNKILDLLDTQISDDERLIGEIGDRLEALRSARDAIEDSNSIMMKKNGKSPMSTKDVVLAAIPSKEATAIGKEKPLTAPEIAGVSGVPLFSVRYHLKTLGAEKLVAKISRGRFVRNPVAKKASGRKSKAKK